MLSVLPLGSGVGYKSQKRKLGFAITKPSKGVGGTLGSDACQPAGAVCGYLGTLIPRPAQKFNTLLTLKFINPVTDISTWPLVGLLKLNDF